MSTSQEKVLKMRQIRREQAEFRATRPNVLDEKQYQKLKKAFYIYAEENGWYADLDKAIQYNGKYIWDWQNEIFEETLRSVFQKKGYNIFLSVKRQEGKTEAMALVLVFCYENYFITFGDPFGVGIVGPGRMMSSTVFKRLGNYLLAQASELAVDQSEYKESLRGDSLTSLSISETGGTTIEGRTLNFVLRDESHLGSDKRWRDEVLWTTAAKEGATVAMLGCAGYRKCDFMAALQGGTVGSNKVHIVDYDRLKPYMKDLGGKGLILAQTWLERTDKLIRLNGGFESPETRKNVFCEWQCELGGYLSEDQIALCTKSVRTFNPMKDQEELVAFIDMGYSGDRSMVGIMNMDSHIIDMKCLKEKNELLALRDQLEIFFEWCDEHEYTPAFSTIGIDVTGLGRGAKEILQEMSPCDVFEVNFSLQSKHEMYTTFKNHVITGWKEDRITFPEDHELMPQVIEELSELDMQVADNGLIKFHAPINMGVKKYDDACDMLVGLFHTLLEFKKEFNKLTPYKKRHNRQAIFKRKLEQKAKKKQLFDENTPGLIQKKRKQRTILGQTVGAW